MVVRARILGGGVAGLSCALALSRRAEITGVRVYERETSRRPPQRAGHGLLLMQNGAEALRTLGAGAVNETRLAEILADQYRVAVVPGSPRFFGPGAAGHIRISFATSREILAEGLDRLEAGLGELAQSEQ